MGTKLYEVAMIATYVEYYHVDAETMEEAREMVEKGGLMDTTFECVSFEHDKTQEYKEVYKHE